MSSKPASPSIPKEFTDAAAADKKAKDDARRERAAQHKRIRCSANAVRGFRHAMDGILARWDAPANDAGPCVARVERALLTAATTLYKAGRMNGWERLSQQDHDAVYKNYAQPVGSYARSRPAYQLACRLLEMARDDELPEGLLFETWKNPDLRDALYFLNILVDGLGPGGAALPGMGHQLIVPATSPHPPAAVRKGRPRMGDRGKQLLVISALVRHHGWQSDGSIEQFEPASTAQLAALATNKQASVSVATVSRFFARKYPERGYAGYAADCIGKRIGMKLTLWQGLADEHLSELFLDEAAPGDRRSRRRRTKPIDPDE
jgi:hypothetical protein